MDALLTSESSDGTVHTTEPDCADWLAAMSDSTTADSGGATPPEPLFEPTALVEYTGVSAISSTSTACWPLYVDTLVAAVHDMVCTSPALKPAAYDVLPVSPGSALLATTRDTLTAARLELPATTVSRA